MNNNNIGFSINGDIKRTDKNVLRMLREIGTCAISDALKNFNTMHYSIKPVCEEVKIAGNAITVRMRSADNLMLHKAISMAKEGDIIVVDTNGSESNAILGELMTASALRSGVAGIVIDGGIRDILELKKINAPVFAKYITPAVADRHGPGEINNSISCGGVPVNPGDIIIGDANGVVVVKQEIGEEVLKLAQQKLKDDNNWMDEISKGVFMIPVIDEDLRKNGVIE